jgi:hypothetical protein
MSSRSVGYTIVGVRSLFSFLFDSFDRDGAESRVLTTDFGFELALFFVERFNCIHIRVLEDKHSIRDRLAG